MARAARSAVRRPEATSTSTPGRRPNRWAVSGLVITGAPSAKANGTSGPVTTAAAATVRIVAMSSVTVG